MDAMVRVECAEIMGAADSVELAAETRLRVCEGADLLSAATPDGNAAGAAGALADQIDSDHASLVARMEGFAEHLRQAAQALARTDQDVAAGFAGQPETVTAIPALDFSKL